MESGESDHESEEELSKESEDEQVDDLKIRDNHSIRLLLQGTAKASR